MVLLVAVVLGLAAAPNGALAQATGSSSDEVDAQALMRRLDELYRGTSSQARIVMRVKTQHYERTMEMVAWSEGDEKTLVRILAPKKDRGIATLKVEDNIWNYLPKINRVTKVPPSMMMSSWMGSHFTNDDLVREASYEEDYRSSITFHGQRDGRTVYEVTSLPRENAPVVWGKVVTVLDQAHLLPLQSVYFDDEGQRARVLTFSDPTTFDGRLVPATMRMEPVDKPGEFTEMTYQALEFDVGLPPDLFSLQHLRNP